MTATETLLQAEIKRCLDLIGDDTKGLQEAIAKASRGKCDASCENHYGETRAVRVSHKRSGTDWGYFAYCEAARQEDTDNRGMKLEDACKDLLQKAIERAQQAIAAT